MEHTSSQRSNEKSTHPTKEELAYPPKHILSLPKRHKPFELDPMPDLERGDIDNGYLDIEGLQQNRMEGGAALQKYPYNLPDILSEIFKNTMFTHYSITIIGIYSLTSNTLSFEMLHMKSSFALTTESSDRLGVCTTLILLWVAGDIIYTWDWITGCSYLDEASIPYFFENVIEWTWTSTNVKGAY